MPKITHITVTAGRGFNHPHEQYANFRFDLQLQAEVVGDEDSGAALLCLQQQAEQSAEEHKARILHDVERLRLIRQGEERLAALRRVEKQRGESTAEIAETEEMLRKLTSVPLLLASKQIHPGHADHPETDAWDSDRE